AAATPAAVPAPVAPAVPAQAGGAPLAAALPPPVATVTPAPRPQPVAEAAVATPVSAPASAAPAPLAVADKPAKPAAAPEEPVQNLRDLPEPIQRSIPHVTVGGYIYSKNPADRLLLIDKILRHEGEEVAPGLMLEKLQPREAVFSFKGYRYRVPY
ncbi:general secretion pathway protein GspB, partial [Duganella sp. HH105]|uniref:general secretion pathway protein GspB n=1 Tax=Duganella sp. HH105 TaxID=1781067 RepID=UPI000AF3F906